MIKLSLFIFTMLLTLHCDQPQLKFESFQEARLKLKGSQSLFEYSMPKQTQKCPQGDPECQEGQKPNPTEQHIEEVKQLGSNGKGNLKEEIDERHEIRKKILSYYDRQIGSQYRYQNQETQIRVKSETLKTICKTHSYDFTNPTSKLFNAGQSIDNLYPGSLIQGQYIDKGTESLVSLPISDRDRYKIMLGGNGNFQSITADSSSSQDVNQAIKKSVLSSNGYASGKVLFDMRTSQEVKDLVTQFNINAKVLSMLEIDGGFKGNWKTRKEKFVITMLQGMFSVYTNMQTQGDEQINDPIGVFLKPSFSLNNLKNLEEYGYIGKTNPPLYVNQVDYGRMIIISVDMDQRTKSLFASLRAQHSLVTVDMKTKLNEIFKNQELKVFSIGPFSSIEVSDLKAGNWTGFFNEIPSNAPRVQALTPVSFSLRDFLGRPAYVSNYLEYNSIKCDNKPPRKIEIGFSEVWRSAKLWIKRDGQNSESIINCGSRTDISNYFSDGVDSIRVDNYGGRKRWYKPWSRSVRFTVWVDGRRVFNQTRSCSRCHSSGRVFTCDVNKYQTVEKAVQCR